MVKVGVPRETGAGERRVALVPSSLGMLSKAGVDVVMEAGAGLTAGFHDDEYEERGATVSRDASEVFAAAVVLRVDGSNDVERLREGSVLIGLCRPLALPEASRSLAQRGVTAFALELMPRISRAQVMDALSSQASIAGYKAVLLAAASLPKMFPMMSTAAGTIAPARVLVLGAGVAGLQAIATARRLGAVVQSYDVRPAVKEQVESLGAKFVELGIHAEGGGGYAGELDEASSQRQRELLGEVVAASDAVISTALVPGSKAPLLIGAEAVRRMDPGSVIIDLAAEQGGNCELTKPDEVVTEGEVTILGPTNLPATVPYHASQTYSRNVSSFLTHLLSEGELRIDLEDEITRETLVARDGEVVHERVRERLSKGAVEAVAASAR